MLISTVNCLFSFCQTKQFSSSSTGTIRGIYYIRGDWGINGLFQTFLLCHMHVILSSTPSLFCCNYPRRKSNWNQLNTNWIFNWFWLVSIGFNRFQWDFNMTSDGFNWSRLSLLDQLGPLAPLAYAPLRDFNGTPIGLQLDFNWSNWNQLKTF